MVARMSGDEFIIIVPDIKNKEYLRNIIELINESFQNPFEVLDVQTYVTVSMGISVFQGKNSETNQILRNADIVLHEAKMQGKNNFVLYEDKLEYAINRKKMIENKLQKALENDEFEIYYQPQVDTNYHKIRGIEALLRWKSPELGSVPPSEFISIAEESGLINKIGEWVLKKACMQARKWKEKEYSFDTISVNISPKQVKNGCFFDLIQAALLESGLDPKYLEIEITEGTLIKSIEERSKLLERLINQGIRVSIDDFGKGYSSLNYLTILPINTLKIDKSFIDKICKDNKSLYIVECIIELSKKLNYNVIAEGVESFEQKDLLKKIGCTYIQGYYYSKPLPAPMIEDIFNDKETSYA
jgi:predicted signal transduction protein with EAL and GGDEF domain